MHFLQYSIIYVKSYQSSFDLSIEWILQLNHTELTEINNFHFHHFFLFKIVLNIFEMVFIFLEMFFISRFIRVLKIDDKCFSSYPNIFVLKKFNDYLNLNCNRRLGSTSLFLKNVMLFFFLFCTSLQPITQSRQENFHWKYLCNDELR